MKKIILSYSQSENKLKLLKILDIFKTEIMYNLKKEFDLTEIDSQIIIKKNNFFYKERTINFDTFNNTNIYQLVEYTDLYLISIIHEFNYIGGLITYYPSIERDRLNNFKMSISEYKINIEKNILLVDANDSKIINECKQLVSLINRIAKDMNYKNILFIDENIYITSINKIKKLFPFISLNDSIEQLLLTKKSVLIFDFDTSFNHINRKEILNIKKNATFYVNSIINNKVIELINFNICPTYEEVYDKYKYHDSFDTNKEDIKKLFNSYNDILGIEINYSRLLMYLFNKLHIKEVSPVIAEDDIENEMVANKLFIL